MFVLSVTIHENFTKEVKYQKSNLDNEGQGKTGLAPFGCKCLNQYC